MDHFIAQLSKFSEGSKERKFFESVLDKLGPTFLRRSVEKELKEAHYELYKCMKENFEFQIIINAVTKDELSDTSVGQEESSCQAVDEVADVSVDPLYLNCIKKYLPSNELSNQVKHLGLNQDYVSKVIENRKMSKSEHASFLKQVESNLNSFCEKLVEFTGNCLLPYQTWRDSFNEVINDLEAKARLLRCEEMEGQPKLQTINDQILTYCNELSEGLSMINKLLLLHEKKLSFELDVAQYYSARCKSLAMKMRVLEWKIMEATYNIETIPALKEISDQLDLKEEKLQEELKEKKVILADYERLGTDFNALIEEYTNLRKSIKQQKWAIEEITKNN